MTLTYGNYNSTSKSSVFRDFSFYLGFLFLRIYRSLIKNISKIPKIFDFLLIFLPELNWTRKPHLEYFFGGIQFLKSVS